MEIETKTLDQAIDAGTKAIDLYELGNEDVISRGALRQWLQAAAPALLEAHVARIETLEAALARSIAINERLLAIAGDVQHALKGGLRPPPVT